jgi:uncharacterized protein YjbI with pentapeptide repeats
MATCMGHKIDGSPCGSRILLPNGYCRWHQDQVRENGIEDKACRWTRESLMAAINQVDASAPLDITAEDLSGLNLRDMNLQGLIMWGADLEGVDLRGASLRGAGLQRANLRGARLQGAELRGATLWGSDLRGADLRDSLLEGANFHGADLSKSDLRGVDFQHIDEGNGLHGVRFYQARLEETALTRELIGDRIGEELDGDYQCAREVYFSLEENFQSLGDRGSASWAHIKGRQMIRYSHAPWNARRFYGEGRLVDADGDTLPPSHPRVWMFYLRHTANWLRDLVLEFTYGYGKRPWRAFGLLVALCILLLVLLSLASR